MKLYGPGEHLDLIEAALDDAINKKRSVAFLLQQASILKTPHWLHPDSIPISQPFCRTLGVTPQTLKATGIFEIQAANPEKHSAAALKLADGIHLDFSGVNPSPEIDVISGKKRRKPTSAIKSRDSTGAKAVYRNRVIPVEVPLNISALKELATDQGATDRERSAAELLIASSPNGKFYQEYVEHRTGRLYGQGNSLQNVPRRTRRAALNGREVDLQNCHPTIAAHFAIQQGIDAPVITAYAADPTAIREELADTLGIEIDTAKTLLLAATFLAHPRGALADIVTNGGGDPENVGGTLIRAYQGEIRRIAKQMIVTAPTRNGESINSLGKGITLNSTPAQVFAHHIQGYEAQCLHALVEAVEVVGSLEHDGLTTLDSEVDLDRLAAAVHKATGIQFTVTLKDAKAKEE